MTSLSVFKKLKKPREVKLVHENPDYYGLNISDRLGDARFERYLNKEYDELTDTEKTMMTRRQFEAVKKHENAVIAEFKEYIESFDGKLKHVRLHQTPKKSYVSLMNTEKEGYLALSPRFIEMLKFLKEKNVSDIVITIGLNHKQNNETTMLIPDQDGLKQLLMLIFKLIDAVGPDFLTLEFGNECNETLILNNNKNKTMISEEIAPKDYARAYRIVSKIVKSKFPGIRFQVAGTSLVDPAWLREVVENVADDSLIDRLSFHPYRDRPSGFWKARTENRDIDINLVQLLALPLEKISYYDIENFFKNMAEEHGATLNVGEIAFSKKSKSPDKFLEEALASSAKNGVVSFIWTEGLPF